jgi:Putative beta-barrel porin 2
MTPPAQALLEFNDGLEKVMVNGSYGISYDSNLFAHAGGAGDYSQSISLGIEYSRRAGLIGVNGSLSVTSGRFNKYTGEDFTNPNLQLEFTKDRGRLTGSLNLTAQRQSSSDVTINERVDVWNFGSSFKFRYPVNDRYFFTSLTDFSMQDYLHNSSLFNLSSYAQSVDVYYTYTSKLDLTGGYRVRVGRAQGGSSTADNALTLGASGAILPKLSGSIAVGYQWRNETGAQGGNYHSVTSSVSLSWPVAKRLGVSGSVSKDFVTTATDVTVDSTSFNLSVALRPTGKINVSPGVGYSISRFLGSKGGGREDRSPTATLGISLALTSHISASISYAYIVNQSNVAFSNFGRQTVGVNLSARY